MNSNICKNICEKALCESAKFCKKNIANGIDIIEITIENNIIMNTITKDSNPSLTLLLLTLLPLKMDL
jgi:hypothetical protein